MTIDKETRSKVIDLAREQIKNIGYIMADRIARELGLSECQVVHILEKEGFYRP